MWKLAVVAILAGCPNKSSDRSHVASDEIRVAPPTAKQHVPGRTTISGHVLDSADRSHVASVKVVLKSQAGELEAIANADGAYELTVPPGPYRVFVRDDHVMSVGIADRPRVDPVAPTS